MFKRMEQYLVERRLAGPLAIWGKLPGHADYISQNAAAADTAVLQRWVAEHWRPPGAPRAASAQDRHETGWMHTAHPEAAPHDDTLTPVIFVLATRGRGWSKTPHCLRGAIVPSQDRIGRPHPLIVYQRVTPRWLRRRLPAACGSPDDLLYWVARILARWQLHHDELASLSQAVQALDALQTPRLAHVLFGDSPVPISSTGATALVEALGREDILPDAMEPQTPPLTRPAASLPDRSGTSFWQSDANGTLLRLAPHWNELWKLRT